MSTSFNPSTFDKQAAASLVELGMSPEDLKRKQEHVAELLHLQAGPTLTPQPQTQPASPKTPTVTVSDGHGGQFTVADPHLEEFPKQRKKRSDAGIPKKAPEDPDEIVLRLTLTEARMVALGDPDFGISVKIQDQIIAQLQKKIDVLSRSK